MSDYVNIFSTREEAVIIWMFIVVLIAICYSSLTLPFRNIPEHIISGIKPFFEKTILTIFTLMGLYLFLAVLLLYKVGLWKTLFLKDTILWSIGTAFVLLLDAGTVRGNISFKKLLFDSMKLILLLEFIVNFHTYSFWIEFIQLPLLIFLASINALVVRNEELKPIRKPANYLLSIYVTVLITITLINTYNDYRNFLSLENLHALLLPPLLTFIYLPFIYLFALYMAYETLFKRLDIFVNKDNQLARFAKLKTIKMCFINLARLNSFANEIPKGLLNLQSKEDILELINNFKNQEK